ncbi:MAG: metalloregulator ArsR/SmtB family transcription factor [Cucumibacter sp.]
MANIKIALVALADPTRRRIFERLGRGPQPVGILARGLPVSRPAVSQHLKVLKAAGLVTDRADGAKRIYRIDPAGLGPIRKWLDRFWGEALDAFAAEVEKSGQDNEASGKQ